MIGTTLDNYEVLQKVGEGGMATVYRGRQTTLNRDVAIKVLHPHLSSSVRNRKRFHGEASAIKRLDHDNILRIIDYSGPDATDLYIVTEFVEGDTLTALLQARGKLPSEVVAVIGIHVARALMYAHRQGILHRDLKTDNVMVRIDGTVKLMDFGIARFLDGAQVTMTGALVGSPAFMSPEQAREAELDFRSDLFALGTVLYYLVTGHLPFSGSNPSLILKNVIEGNRPHVSELAPTMSASLADVIERLMATDPEDRHNTAEDVEVNLLACLAEARIESEGFEWSLENYLEDPVAYEERLDEHLRTVLLDEGRRVLGDGDHLAALRLFNRLLSMDEDNEEVLALVQGLHQGDALRSRRIPAWIAGGALTAVVLGLLALWAVSQIEVPTDPPAPDPAPLGVVSPPPVPTPPPPVQPEPVPDPEPRVEAPQPRVERPAPTVRPPAPEPVIEEEPGFVRVNTGALIGEVWLGEKRLGSSRDGDLAVEPGTMLLTIRPQSGLPDLFREQQVEATVSSGETLTLKVDLVVNPVPITFPAEWPGSCQVMLDGVQQGTLTARGYRVVVRRPDEQIQVGVSCDAGPELTVPYAPGTLLPPGREFPGVP